MPEDVAYENRGSDTVPFGFVYNNDQTRRNGWQIKDGRIELFNGGGWSPLTDKQKTAVYRMLEEDFASLLTKS